MPDVRYARSGEPGSAYEVRRSGPIDLVHVPSILNTIERGRVASPGLVRFDEQVQRFARLVDLDESGMGSSDRLAPSIAGKWPLLAVVAPR